MGRTNARLDKEMFSKAEQEFRRVGGQGAVELSMLADQAAHAQEEAARLAKESRTSRAKEREEDSARKTASSTSKSDRGTTEDLHDATSSKRPRRSRSRSVGNTR